MPGEASTMSSAANDTVYVDKAWLHMRWDSEHDCLFAEWKGFATSAEFQGALLKAVDAIRQRHAAAFVNDIRRLELVSDQDQRWLMSTWPPLVIAAGLKRLAIVMAKTGLSKMAVEEMIRAGANAPSGGTGAPDAAFQSRTFDSVADALVWVATPLNNRR